MRLTKGMKDLIIEMENYNIIRNGGTHKAISYPEQLIIKIIYYFSEDRKHQENNIKYFQRCIKYGIYNELIVKKYPRELCDFRISTIKNGRTHIMYPNIDIIILEDTEDSDFRGISSEESSTEEELDKFDTSQIQLYFTFIKSYKSYLIDIYEKPPTMVKSARK